MSRSGAAALVLARGHVPAADVARALRMWPSTVQRALAAGRMPGGKIGRSWYVDVPALLESGAYPNDGMTAPLHANLAALLPQQRKPRKRA